MRRGAPRHWGIILAMLVLVSVMCGSVGVATSLAAGGRSAQVPTFVPGALRQLGLAGGGAELLQITPFAGAAGTAGFADGVGNAARFSFPSSVACDAAGNVYVADAFNNRLRKISPAGVVTTLAGAAGFSTPYGVACDAAGNVYVADTGNHTIRRVSATGVVTTLAGEAGVSGSADGTGAAARFNRPLGVACDAAGNVYVADSGNHTIRKVTPAGVVTTLAGTAGVSGIADGTGSAAGFNGPHGLACDAAGNVYVADYLSHTIRKVTPAGVVTTLAGSPLVSGTTDGAGAAARFSSPFGVACDAAGNVYVADSGNHTIRRLTPAGVVTTLAGAPGVTGSADGTGSAARLNGPRGVACDAAGNVYVADGGNHIIRRGVLVPAARIGVTQAAGGTISLSGQSAAAPAGVLVALGADQSFTITADAHYHLVDVTVDGSSVGAVTSYTFSGLAADHTITASFAANGAELLQVTTLAGSPGLVGSADGTGGAARFNYPAVACDAGGNVYVADTYNQTIRKVTPAGVVTTLAGTAGVSGSADGTGAAARFNRPTAVACDAAGNLYVADFGNHTIRKVTPAGVVTTLAGTAGSPGSADGTGAAARFSNPGGVACDAAGNVYVADFGNHTIRKVTPTAVVTTLAGTAGSPGSADGTGASARFNGAYGVACDAGGNVYVADAWNHTIRKVTPAGVVTTLAGTAGSPGSTDGTGSAARLNGPRGVACDVAGNLYVADGGNHTIRKGVFVPAARIAVTQAAGGTISLSEQSAAAPAGVLVALGADQTFTITPDAHYHLVDVTVDGSSVGAVTSYTFSSVSADHTITASFAANSAELLQVTTLAGAAGVEGSADGTGAAARFAYPTGVACDAGGNVYVADQWSDTIRKVTPAGVVTTLAGTAGASGSADGTGAAARFFSPTGVACDASGTLYVADNWNNTIRKVTPAGVVTTLAGSPLVSGSADGTGAAARFNAPYGVACDAAGNLYVADSGNHTIRKVTPAGVVTTLAGAARVWGSADGTGAAARFNYPTGLACDAAGNVYVADDENHTIRKVTPAGVVTTLAGAAGVAGSADGTGAAARFNAPNGLACDAGGNVYAADAYNHTIRKVTPAGVVTTLAGSPGLPGSTDGAGGAARFNNPLGIACDAVGRLYVADPTNHTIRKGAFVPAARIAVTQAAGGTISLAGQSAAAPAEVLVTLGTDQSLTITANAHYHLVDVTVDGSSVGAVTSYTFGSISADHTITASFAANGAEVLQVTTLAGLAGSPGSADGSSSTARFTWPTGVACDAGGTVYVADTSNHTIRKVTPDGVVTTLAGTAGSPGSADGSGTAARFNAPFGVACDAAGTVYVADSYNHTIRKVTPAGVVTTLAGSAGASGSADGSGSAARFNAPGGIACDAAGNVYVADYWNHTIRRITPTGVVTTLAGTAGSPGSANGTGSAARFDNPTSVACDAAGTVYVADQDNNTIRKITPAGVVTTLAGSPGDAGSADGTGSAARFSRPHSVACDAAGTVYVADAESHTIRQVSPAGVVTTLAGSPGASGSAGGTGGSARFNLPYGIACDAAGTIYVADANNHTIRKGVFVPAARISVTQAAGGTISLSGQSGAAPAGVLVALGADQSFTITADAGYRVGDVQVDGSSVGAVTSYTFSGLAADHTITANFAAGLTLDGFTPMWGLVGATVTLTGTGFTDATAVEFNGTPSTSFTVDSDVQITATVPVGATTGVLSVTTPRGIASGAPAFSVVLPADGGWTAESSGTTQHLLGVAFADATHGWAVGEGGTILATGSGGGTWAAQNSGSTEWLLDVAFADATHGWAVGEAGTILATDNGGTAWAAQNSGSTEWLWDVALRDVSHGWAVGEAGTILVTSNGGATWTAQPSGTTQVLRGVAFADTNHGWAVGEAGTILVTSNGGATWTAQSSGSTELLYGVAFSDATHGWAVGAAGTILVTTDGGATWAAQSSGSTELLLDVAFSDATHGWAVGDFGTVLATADGGDTWTAQRTGTGEALFGIAYNSTLRAWIVGSGGTVLATTTGGSTPGGISGTVTDGTTGLAGIRVSVWSDTPTGWRTSWGATTATGGTYEIGSVPEGEYRVQFWDASGGYIGEYYNDQGTLAAAQDVTVTAGRTTKGIHAVLRLGGRISGTVRDAAGGLSGVEVNAYQSNGTGGWTWLARVTSGSGGAYDLGPLPAGAVRLWFLDRSGAYVSEYYSDKRSLAAAADVTVTAGATTRGIDALLEAAGSVSGAVTNASGRPAADVSVQAYRDEGSGWTYYNGARTGTAGTYTLGGLGAGVYRIFFTDPSGGYVAEYFDDKSGVALAADVTVKVGETRAGVDAVLATAGRVSGTVTGPAGGVSGITVVAYQPNGSGGWTTVTSVRTASGGTYDLGGLATGPCRIQFWDTSGANAIEFYNDEPTLTMADDVGVTAGVTTTGIDARIAPPGRISGTVTDGSVGLAGILVSAWYRSAGLSEWAVVRSTRTASGGTYDLGPLPAADYRVRFQDTTFTYARDLWFSNVLLQKLASAVTVNAGVTTTGIDASLPLAGSIRGAVKDALGMPLADIAVTAYLPDGSGGWIDYGSGVTAADGTYEVGGLPTGGYKLWFHGGDPDHLSEYYENKASLDLAAEVPVTAGATTSAIDVRLASGLAPSISGFTPASGPAGTTVTITGTGLTDASVVSFNGSAATSFTVDSSIRVRATVPASATTGKVSVTTPGGTATSTAAFTVTPIAITSPTATSSWPSGSTQTVAWTIDPAVDTGEFRVSLVSSAGTWYVNKQVLATAGQRSYSTSVIAAVPAASGYKAAVYWRPTVGAGTWLSSTKSAAFTVTPINITMPAATTVWPTQATTTVSWNVNPALASGEFRVSLVGSGGTWYVNKQVLAVAGKTSYSTAVNTLVPAGSGYKAAVYWRATVGSGTWTATQKSAAFTIAALTITEPTAASSWKRLTSQSVAWSVAPGLASGEFRVSLVSATSLWYVNKVVPVVPGQTLYSTPVAVSVPAAAGYKAAVYWRPPGSSTWVLTKKSGQFTVTP